MDFPLVVSPFCVLVLVCRLLYAFVNSNYNALFVPATAFGSEHVSGSFPLLALHRVEETTLHYASMRIVPRLKKRMNEPNEEEGKKLVRPTSGCPLFGAHSFYAFCVC